MLQSLKKQDSRKLISRLMRDFVAPYKSRLALACFFMVLVALATTALPYMLKPIIDNGFSHPETSTLFWVCFAVFMAFFVKGVASYGESVVMTFVGQRIISDIQNHLFKHLMKADLAFFHRTPSGELLSCFTNDVNMMRNAMENTIIALGKDSITLISLVALMFYRDPRLALIAFVVFPIAVLPILKIGRRMRKVTFHTQDQHAFLTSQLTQIFQGIRVVKAYGMEQAESNHTEKQINTIFQLIYKATRIRSASHPIMEVLAGLAIAGVLAYGGWEVMHGLRTPGDFASFIGALLLVYEPLKRLSNLNARLQEGVAAASRVLQIIDMPPSIKNPDKPHVIDRLLGHVQFKDVTFSYQNQKRPVLNNFSFEAKQGQTIALVGASGAGKSTIINLIPRFYDIDHGTIFIDGIDIKDMHIHDLRHQIALVSQEIALFDRTIFENIAYSENNISMDQVIQAAKDAAAHDFIEQLPDGYNTFVGENGVKLSGGQRQRISIARAMLKNAPILLLDEATSALDTDSERQIQDALSHLMKGRTTILVAHRLSTVIDSDWIYVLDHGKLVEGGKHSDLLEQNGVYARLWKKQSSRKH